MAATSFPCWLKQQLLMLLSCSSAVHYKPDKADRRICFCHSWQQPQADRRLHFQLVFYHSDCFNSMNMVFLVSCCVQCSLLREAGGVSHCPSTFLTLMARGQRSHTSETEQTHAKPFCCSRKNFAATLHLCKLILSIIRSKCLCFTLFSCQGGWKGREDYSFSLISKPILVSLCLSNPLREQRVPGLCDQPTHKPHPCCSRTASLLKCNSFLKSFSSGAAANGLLLITWLFISIAIIV